mgnify:CR=1 FL=1
MAISKQGKQIWGSKAGGSLMGKMLSGEALTEQDQQTLAQLKQGGGAPIPEQEASQQQPPMQEADPQEMQHKEQMPPKYCRVCRA